MCVWQGFIAVIEQYIRLSGQETAWAGNESCLGSLRKYLLYNGHFTHGIFSSPENVPLYKMNYSQVFWPFLR